MKLLTWPKIISLVLIDINCDMGEILKLHENGTYELLMPHIHSVNIACGYHAGSEYLIKKTIENAQKYNLNIGWHPGFDDKLNFGRLEIDMNETQLRSLLFSQFEIFFKIADTMNAEITHVKPHGALYNMAAKNEFYALNISKTLKEIDAKTVLFAQANSQLSEIGKNIGLKVKNEVFADRNYDDAGFLVNRQKENALIVESSDVYNHVFNLLKGEILTITNKTIKIKADTICVHGDSENALIIAKTLKKAIKDYEKQ